MTASFPPAVEEEEELPEPAAPVPPGPDPGKTAPMMASVEEQSRGISRNKSSSRRMGPGHQHRRGREGRQ